MIKLNINIFYLLVAFVGFVNAAKGQKYTKDLLTHKVIVNQVDRSVVAYVKPVKSISLDNDKRYYWFSTNQINSTQGGFSGKLLNGDYKEFYMNKQLRESGYLNKGLKVGIWKNWDEEGNLKDDYNWTSGEKNGIYHKYDSVGKMQESGRYKNDLLHGKQKIYDTVGVSEQLYKKGKITERKKIPTSKFLRKIFNKKARSIK